MTTTTSPQLILALSKGRIFEDTLPLPGIDWQIDVDVEKAGRFGADVATVGAMVQLVTRGILLDTMSHTVTGRARLKAAGVTPPAVMITAEDVERGKPDPAGYRLAARKLGFDVGRSIVLEDAGPGAFGFTWQW